jgi:hypothetical protein
MAQPGGKAVYSEKVLASGTTRPIWHSRLHGQSRQMCEHDRDNKGTKSSGIEPGLPIFRTIISGAQRVKLL